MWSHYQTQVPTSKTRSRNPSRGPLVGGALIAIVGIGLTAIYALGGSGDPQMDPSSHLFVYGLLFAPAIAGGHLLAIAGWLQARETSGT
jgi:hypothetical protein